MGIDAPDYLQTPPARDVLFTGLNVAMTGNPVVLWSGDTTIYDSVLVSGLSTAHDWQLWLNWFAESDKVHHVSSQTWDLPQTKVLAWWFPCLSGYVDIVATGANGDTLSDVSIYGMGHAGTLGPAQRPLNSSQGSAIVVPAGGSYFAKLYPAIGRAHFLINNRDLASSTLQLSYASWSGAFLGYLYSAAGVTTSISGDVSLPPYVVTMGIYNLAGVAHTYDYSVVVG